LQKPTFRGKENSMSWTCLVLKVEVTKHWTRPADDSGWVAGKYLTWIHLLI